MKTTLILLFALLAHPALAQKQAVETVSIDDDIAAYRFESARTRLQADIQRLTRRRRANEQELLAQQQDRLEQVNRLSLLIDATQHITFIDSIVVERKNFFQHFALSEESGRITPYAKTFRTSDTLGCTVFRPEMGYDAYYAQPVDSACSRLFRSTMTAGDWGNGEPLRGLPDEDVTQNYPFLLSDGLTLYYGAINPEEGLGGYDIYTTRYDQDEKRFLQAENLGMPFNSMANDYMLAIDEYNQLGWFVTDRRQPADTVCIYVFIPTDTRTNWLDEGNLTAEQLAGLALISSIADTQTDEKAVAAARKRLALVRDGKRQREVRRDFTFYVANDVVYYTLADFKQEAARQKAAEWQKASGDLQTAEMQLDALRSQYATANEARQSQLRPQILNAERGIETQRDDLQALENLIRQLETRQ